MHSSQLKIRVNTQQGTLQFFVPDKIMLSIPPDEEGLGIHYKEVFGKNPISLQIKTIKSKISF